MAQLHEPAILDALDVLDRRAFRGIAYRVSWLSVDPLLGSSGGRWCRPGSFEALYCSESDDGAVAEVYYHLSRAPVRSSSAKLLNRLSFEVENAIEIDAGLLEWIGGTLGIAAPFQVEFHQQVGAAAAFLGADAFFVPSMRWDCRNVVFVLDRIGVDACTVVESVELNWPAWSERNAFRVSR